MATSRAVGTGRYVTVEQVCEDLDIARSTFYDWRAKGKLPLCTKLPNGELRIKRVDYERWLDTLEEVTA